MKTDTRPSRAHRGHGSSQRVHRRRTHTTRRVTSVTREKQVRTARVVRSRFTLFRFGMVLVAFVFVFRLLNVQVIAPQRYVRYGENQRMRSINLAADRGTIFDRSGIPLAVSTPSKTLWANPRQIEDPYVTANAIAPILQTDAGVVEQRLRSKSAFAYIARQVDDDMAKRVLALKLPGIYSLDEPKRKLLTGALGSSIIGKVGVDNLGLSGLELKYNKDLAGKPGQMYAERDISGQMIPGGKREGSPTVQGKDLVLTIDQSLQQITQLALQQEIEKAHAKGGIAVVMQTKTGDVLSLTNLVRDKETGQIVEASNNMAATNVYEPGSVNKMITVAGALEEGIVSPGTGLLVPPTIRVADKTFSEHDYHPAQTWSVTDIIANSSNVGTIEIGQKLGKKRIDSYMRRFGFGSKTALGFPGESSGILLKPRHWYPTSIGTVPIGQGISVTAMQMISAYNTIANGGMYVEPRLVRATVGSNGHLKERPAAKGARVVSAQTAEQVRGMLDEVTRVGTGTLAQIDGYTVAGKTGTARKPKVGGAGYQDGAYVSSFAGFVPSENPELTAMVILDEPTPIYGGLVAAPVFSQIMKYALAMYQIAPPPHRQVPGVPQANASAVDTNEAQAARIVAPRKTTKVSKSTKSGQTAAIPNTQTVRKP